MHIVEVLSISIAAIRSNKLRSLLTTLGIIIGVASVLAMIAIGDGAKEIVHQDAQRLGGANQFFRVPYVVQACKRPLGTYPQQ